MALDDDGKLQPATTDREHGGGQVVDRGVYFAVNIGLVLRNERTGAEILED